MTTKSDFSATEWAQLINAPHWVYHILANVDRESIFMKRKEAKALDKFLEEHSTTSRLAKQIIGDQSEADDNLRGKVDAGIAELEKVGELLANADAADANAVRKMLNDAAQTVAESVRESRGFINRDKTVSKAETAALADIKKALGSNATVTRRSVAGKRVAGTAAAAAAGTSAAEAARQKAEVAKRAAARRAAKGDDDAAAQKAAVEARAKARKAKKAAEAQGDAAAQKAAVEARKKERLAKKAAEEKAAAAEARAAEAAEKRKKAAAERKQQQMKAKRAAAEQKMKLTRAKAAKEKEAAAAAAAEAAAAAAMKSYTVKSGDTLSGISLAMYGTANRWQEIFEANSDILKNPSMIYPGQELKIPA